MLSRTKGIASLVAVAFATAAEAVPPAWVPGAVAPHVDVIAAPANPPTSHTSNEDRLRWDTWTRATPGPGKGGIQTPTSKLFRVKAGHHVTAFDNGEEAFEQDGREVGARGVDRGGVRRRPAADDDHVLAHSLCSFRKRAFGARLSLTCAV